VAAAPHWLVRPAAMHRELGSFMFFPDPQTLVAK
jgi:hypothetical protein